MQNNWTLKIKDLKQQHFHFDSTMDWIYDTRKILKQTTKRKKKIMESWGTILLLDRHMLLSHDLQI